MAVMSEAAAGIDAKHVMAVGQPRAHGVQPALVAGRLLVGSLRPLVLKSSHARSTLIPTPPKRATNRSRRAYTRPGLNGPRFEPDFDQPATDPFARQRGSCSETTASTASTNSWMSCSPIGVDSAPIARGAIRTPWLTRARKKSCVIFGFEVALVR